MSHFIVDEMVLPSAWGYINDAINITKTMQGISLDSLPIYQVKYLKCSIEDQVQAIEMILIFRNALVYWKRQNMTLQLQHHFM